MFYHVEYHIAEGEVISPFIAVFSVFILHYVGFGQAKF